MLQDIVFNVPAGANDQIGTGTRHNAIDINQVKTIVLTEPGLIYDAAEDMKLAYVQELQQKGQAIVISGVLEVADNTAEDNSITRTGSGIVRITGRNPYDWTFTFDEGVNFHKALSRLSGFKKYDIAFMDGKGDLFFTQNKALNNKGFTTGLVQAGKYGISNGADANSQTLRVQLINRDEFDKRAAYIVSDNLDWSYEDVDGYNDVTLEMTSPADAATTIAIKVISSPDLDPIAIQGLDVADFLYQVDGATVAITTVTPGTTAGDYVLTVPALATGDEVYLRLFDSTLNANIINVDGILYKSNEATSIVA